MRPSLRPSYYYVNPQNDRPFPWHTVRHELFHVFLKSKIRSKLKKYAISLPVSPDYYSQTFRENLEEYVVRSLNLLFLRHILGHSWYRKQINHEVTQGFKFMPQVIFFIQRWQKTKEPFSRLVFIELVKFLQQKD